MPMSGDAATDAQADAPADDVVSLAARCPQGNGATADTSSTVIYASAELGSAYRGAAIRGAFVDTRGRIVGYGSTLGLRMDTANTRRGAVWRFEADDFALDPTFAQGLVALDSQGVETGAEWFAGAEDAQGRIWVAGFQDLTQGRSGAVVGRFNNAGELDASFGMGGRVTLPSARLRPSSNALIAAAVLPDDRGAMVLVNDGLPFSHAATHGWLVRLDDRGALATDFGTEGVLALDDLTGCFALTRDRDAWVLACISSDDRPALVRIGDTGARMPWPSGATLLEGDTPRRFEVRSLARDSVGRWVVGGSISGRYDDVHAPPAAVRFTADGRVDRGFGYNGLALGLGPRQSAAYTFGASLYVGCEDRVLLGASYGPRPTLVVLDAAGRTLDALTEQGHLTLATAPGAATALVSAVLPMPNRHDVVVISIYAPSAIVLQRVRM